ncbi:MAG: FMN-binding protein [Calothrix sp. SM1_7_51]|nr:FMN-binding protein [Calothrix sp. SM1_7_51]
MTISAIFLEKVNAQKVNVDAVTGATTTSKALLLAIENALQNQKSKI